jgi:hypothetical protein
MVVDHRGEQVVRGGDRVHVTGQVQVQQLERDRLAVAAAGRAALDAERRAHAGLADRDRGGPADVPERHPEADRGGGLALAERSGRDRGDDDVLGLRAVLQLFDGPQVDLGDVIAVLLDQPGRDADALGDFGYRLQRGLPRDFQCGWHRHTSEPPAPLTALLLAIVAPHRRLSSRAAPKPAVR